MLCRRDAKQCNNDVFGDILWSPRNRGRALGAVAGFATSRPSAFHSHPNLNKRSQVTINCLVTWEAFKTRQFRQCSLDQLGNQSQQDSPRRMSNIFEGSPICYRAHLHVAPLFGGRPGATRGGKRVVDGLARLFWNRLQSHNC